MHWVICHLGQVLVLERKEKFYRYYCTVYPAGISPNADMLMCDDEAIEEILFEGFEDEKTSLYNQKLCQLVEEYGIAKKFLSNL